MSETAPIPKSGRLAYVGPALRGMALRRLAERGYEVREIDPDGVLTELAADTDLLVMGLGLDHPAVAGLQREALRRNLAAVSDLAMLAEVEDMVPAKIERRILISGSAGKSTTAALAEKLLAQGGIKAEEIGARDGYLNGLAASADGLILTAEPSAVRHAEGVGCGIGVLLNLTEEGGLPVGEKARDACASFLSAVPFGILGTDDSGTQSLMMTVRRRYPAAARSLLPISGGATLSDGWFALDRAIYAIRNGRTWRVASYQDSASLLGDHMAQNAAAAAALASRLGITDDQIAKGLAAYRGMRGRFDFIGTEGRIVFVDDRYAKCAASTRAAIASCPEVFWIGTRCGGLPERMKAGIRGSFYLETADGSGPPVDNVVTFRNAEDAAEAALRAARELIRREPQATPVVLFSPGVPGYEHQGDLFKLSVLHHLSERDRSHG